MSLTQRRFLCHREETLQQIDEFRAQEMSDDQEQLEKLAQLWDQENVRALHSQLPHVDTLPLFQETSSTWLSNYRTSFENLVRRRGEEIDSASVMRKFITFVSGSDVLYGA